MMGLQVRRRDHGLSTKVGELDSAHQNAAGFVYETKSKMPPKIKQNKIKNIAVSSLESIKSPAC